MIKGKSDTAMLSLLLFTRKGDRPVSKNHWMRRRPCNFLIWKEGLLCFLLERYESV